MRTGNNQYKYFIKISMKYMVLILIWIILPESLIFGALSTEATEVFEIESRLDSHIIISNDTIWTLNKSPYIISNNVLVEQDVKLTIEPGVLIKFDKNKTLRVDGELYAIGTRLYKITFTSNKANPEPGDWNGINFFPTSKKSSLKYCNINYGSGISNSCDELLEISHCRISNNSETRKAIHNEASIIISNSIITRNKGGGVCNRNNMIIQNCIISRNTAEKGGGVFNTRDAIIYNSTITRNIASNGGGIANNWNDNEDECLYIYNCTITENLAKFKGGGIYNFDDGNLIVKYSKIKNNSASLGSGIYSCSETEIYNSTIVENNANNNSSAIYIYHHCSVIIENSNLDNLNYNIHFESSDEIKATNNWWGTINTDSINRSIYDFQDNFYLGKVEYIPFLKTPADINYTYQSSNIKNNPNENDNLNRNDPNQSRTENILSSSGFKTVAISLTTISIPQIEWGEYAAKVLHQMIEQEKEIIIEKIIPNIKIRDSI